MAPSTNSRPPTAATEAPGTSVKPPAGASGTAETTAKPPAAATLAPSTAARQPSATTEAPDTSATGYEDKKRMARLVEDEFFYSYGFDDGNGVKFAGYEELVNTGRYSMR